MTTRILRIDGSMRRTGSVSRDLSDILLDQLETTLGQMDVTVFDTVDGVPFVSEDWIGASFTDPADRTDAQNQVLAFSDARIAEVKDADILVIGAPVYNFSVPAALKAWMDMVARARETFKYTEQGPVGLLTGKKAYVVVASGGTKAGSEVDFATPYIRHFLGFIGISDVTFVSADQLMIRAEETVAEAKASISAIAA